MDKEELRQKLAKLRTGKKPLLIGGMILVCLCFYVLFSVIDLYYQDAVNNDAPRATIVLTDSGFEIVPRAKLFYFDEAADHVIAGLSHVKGEGTPFEPVCQAAARITEQNDNLQAECERLNNIYKHKIVLDMTDAQVTLDNSTFKQWMKYEDGKLTFDQDAVYAYVKDLAKQYDTFYTERDFVDVTGKTRKVGGTNHDTYGFWLNGTETTAELMQALQSEKDVNTKPVWRVQANTRKGMNGTDINNTYIEVDISRQHMWYFKDGKLVIDTDVVTGKESDPTRKTPEGLYQVLTKAQDYTMSGNYGSAFCHYWMAISWDGVGIHDLNRTAWGGTEYITNGSHGCINTPLGAVKAIFESVPTHTPVIVYRS